jgi:hypothetical protein
MGWPLTFPHGDTSIGWLRTIRRTTAATVGKPEWTFDVAGDAA